MEPSNQKSNPVQVTLPNLVKHLLLHALPQAKPHPPPHPQPHVQTDDSLSQSMTSAEQSRPVGQTNSNQSTASSVALGHSRVGQAQSSQDSRQASVPTQQDMSSRHEDASSKIMESRHEDASAKTVESLPSSQLTQPVPLDMLIQHNILEPGPRTLTCTILVCISLTVVFRPMVSEMLQVTTTM